jgi:hypothetical protein
MPKRSKDRKVPAQRIDAMERPADFPAGDGKDKAAQSLGQRGGWARARALSPRRRKEIAQKAAAMRWKT